MFQTFINSLVSLSVCLVAGYICRKLRVINDTMNAALSTLLVKVTLPCTVFMSMMRPFSQTLLAESMATFFLSAAVYLSGFVIGWALAKLLKAKAGEKRLWQFALIFGNVGYMGFPVSQAVFGDEGMIYTSMANAAFNVLAFTLGVSLFAAETPKSKSAWTQFSRWKPILLNPALIAIFLGFIFFITGIRLPATVNDGVSMIGAMTTPLSMLLVGSVLAKNKLSSLFKDIKILPVIAARLLCIPLATLFVLRLFLSNSVMLGVIVVLAAMPVASLTVIFAEQYKGDTSLASRLVALSTLLCILTIPLISLFL